VEFLAFPYWSSILVLVLIAFLPDVVKWILSGIAIVSMGFSFVSSDVVLPLLGAFLVVNLLRSWYGFAQKNVLTLNKRISQLEEGDISGELIAVRNGKVVRESAPNLKTIIKAGSQRNLKMLFSVISPEGEVLATPRQAAGFFPDQIERLQAEVKKGNLTDEIKIKASAPFAPAVFLAYGVLSAFGDGPLAWWYG
ncbi:MAG: A24 family peptidase C-terminal domain-containing protein, partial [archaeon]